MLEFENRWIFCEEKHFTAAAKSRFLTIEPFGITNI